MPSLESRWPPGTTYTDDSEGEETSDDEELVAVTMDAEDEESDIL